MVNMSGSELYNLQWNHYQSTLASCVTTLFEDSDFCDVTIACDGQSFAGHKVVLSASSEYVKRLLKRNPCQHPIIVLKDVRATVIQYLMQFIYYGAVDIPQDYLAEFLKAAEGLEIKGLSNYDAEQSNEKEIILPEASTIKKRRRLNSSPNTVSLISTEYARSLVQPKDSDSGETECYAQPSSNRVPKSGSQNKAQMIIRSNNTVSSSPKPPANLYSERGEQFELKQEAVDIEDVQQETMDLEDVQQQTSQDYDTNYLDDTGGVGESTSTELDGSSQEPIACPSNFRRRSTRNRYDDATVNMAIEDIRAGLPILQASKLYGIPFSTLHGMSSRAGVRSSYLKGSKSYSFAY